MLPIVATTVLFSVFALLLVYGWVRRSLESKIQDIDALKPTKVSRRRCIRTADPILTLEVFATKLQEQDARFSRRTDTELIAFIGSAAAVKTMGLHTSPAKKIPLRFFARCRDDGFDLGMDEDMGFQIGLPKAPFERLMDHWDAVVDTLVEELDA